MAKFVITSSVLIIALIILRHIFKGKISPRLQYALWLPVLLRLIIPFTLFESPISVMNAVERSSAYKKAEQRLSEIEVYSDIIRDSEMTPDEASEAGKGTLHEIRGYPSNGDYGHLRTYLFTDSLGVVLVRVLRIIWISGAAVTGLILLISNLGFGRKLKKTGIEYHKGNCKLPVYLVEDLPSPCLFGLFRPAIYITWGVAGDETKLFSVLAHEETHYRHGDHIWSAIRGLVLAAHWYNPFVWSAAKLSRRDSETACDEGTIKRIGEESRPEYVQALTGLIREKSTAGDLLCCATIMTDGKKGIKERTRLVAEKPKILLSVLLTVILAAAVAVGCTFTGAGKEAETVPLTAEEAEQYNKLFEQILYDEQGSPYLNPLSHFLTSYYDKPEDINLSRFLRHLSSEDVADSAEFDLLKADINWPHGDVTLEKMPVPIHRIKARDIDSALKKHMGIRLKDLSGVGTAGLIYLKEYDSYYNFTSDFDAGVFNCISGETQGDIVRLFGREATLTLKLTEDGFLFVSHRHSGTG